MLLTRLGLLLLTLALFIGQRPIHSQSSSPGSPKTSLIREEQKIVVNGTPETWRLLWKLPPKPACGAEDASATTCPCTGFAYGEMGQLDLLRMAKGREVDRLALTPLFTEQDGAVIQRWEPLEKDLEEPKTEALGERVRARPIARVMHFGDYNHDGDATEFFLQTDAEPCGKRTGVVVGVTRRNPRLHALGTALHPDKPLVLHGTEWEALLKAAGPIEVLDWACRDHGSEIESDLQLRITNGDIEATRLDFECTEAGSRGRLLRKEQL